MKGTRRLLGTVLAGIAILVVLVLGVTAALKGFDAYCAGRSNVVCN